MKFLKNSTARKVGVLIIVIAIAAGSFFGYNAYAKSSIKQDSSGISYEVKKGNISASVSDTGTIYASDARSITGPNGSTVEGVYCIEGQTVKQGDTLFVLKNDASQLDLQKSRLNVQQLQNQLSTLKNQQADLAIYSTVSGIVKSVNVSSGDSVGTQSYNSLITIQDTSAMKFSILSSAAGENKKLLDALIPGQSVSIAVEGVNGIKAAKVLTVSSGAQGNNITFQVADPSGLSWDRYYGVTLKLSEDVAISTPVQFSGSTVNINAKQSGTVSSIYVKVGDSVRKNQKLLQLSNDNIANQIQSVDINIQSAELDVNNKQSIVDSLVVKAPVDGVVFNIQASAGDLIGTLSSTAKSSGTTASSSGSTLASIENRSSMQVLIPVDELDIGKIQIGQESTISADAFKDKVYKGKVSAIAAKGVVQNGAATFQVTVDIINPEGLKTGMTASVSILTASKENVLLLPVEALQDNKKGREIVHVKNGDKLVAKQVNLGLINSDYAEIISGLNEGDNVVVQSQNKSNSKSIFPSMGGNNGISGGSRNSQNTIPKN